MTIRTAVIGVGHFGRLHAEKYAGLTGSKLVAVVDRDPARAAEVAALLGVAASADFRSLFGQVDAVSIAVPTASHFAVAKSCLEAGLHCLIEKPISETLDEADALIASARQHGLVLQVGHLERFSAARVALDGRIQEPLFIECSRIAPFKPRGTDVSVILDLMIHDIDLILELVKAPILSLDAVGVPVLGDHEDIANARIGFANGCVANVTASRISMKSERTMRLFQRSGYLRVDFLQHKVTVIRRGGPVVEGMPNFQIEENVFEEHDSLKREIEAFIGAVANRTPPLVDGPAGRRALETALAITDSLRRWVEKVA
ncbi:MAG: Gfo/Idh/MocA family oxidoreductase [Proteobacteria bacterium]|nr:Gfo/Idh/MocA family oxidoreductase [Pseudomonadota bacterium]MBI3499321.1 Gfo/Idh/MocA family oxidoreductase [Pseudomonadota bacterium]